MPTDNILSVTLPYHFGWKTKDNTRENGIPIPDGTHQEIDLEKRLGDIVLYKGYDEIGWFKMTPRKTTEEESKFWNKVNEDEIV